MGFERVLLLIAGVYAAYKPVPPPKPYPHSSANALQQTTDGEVAATDNTGTGATVTCTQHRYGRYRNMHTTQVRALPQHILYTVL